MLITVNVVASGGATQAVTVDVPVSQPPAPSGTPMPSGPAGPWTLMFEDTFSGTALDTTKWAPSWFGGGSMNNVKTSPALVAVGGGDLTLSIQDAGTGSLVSTNPHGGANPGFQFTTGFVEARIWFPGNGTTIYNWPAWWTDGQSWPTNGEHDIAEGLGTMTVNYHSSMGAHNTGTVAGIWSNGWHTYGLHRKVGSADVYFDGVLVRSYPTQDGEAPEYLILNVGSSGGHAMYGPAGDVKVDYVRAWQ